MAAGGGAGARPGRGADPGFFVLPLAGPAGEPLGYAAPVAVSFRAPAGAPPAGQVRFRVDRVGAEGDGEAGTPAGELQEYAGVPFLLEEAGVLRVEAVWEDPASERALDRLEGFYRLTQELAGTAVDGYVRGCEVGGGAELDWSLESFAFGSITDFRGHFRFTSDLREGWLALRPGGVCTDLATELPLRVGMVSVVGASVISPFTTVASALLEEGGPVRPGVEGRRRRDGAAACVQRTFRAPEGYDAFSHDPLKEPEARRGRVVAALNQLQNFLVVAASLWGEGNAGRGALAALGQALASRARAHCAPSGTALPALDLTSQAATEDLLQSAGAPGEPWVLSGVSAYVAKMAALGATDRARDGGSDAAVLHSSRVAEAAQGQLLGELTAAVQSGDPANLDAFLLSFERDLQSFLEERVESDRRRGSHPTSGSERARQEGPPGVGREGGSAPSPRASHGLMAAAVAMSVFLCSVLGLWNRRRIRRKWEAGHKRRGVREGPSIVLTDLSSSIRIMEGKQPVPPPGQRPRKPNPLRPPTKKSHAYEELEAGPSRREGEAGAAHRDPPSRT